MFLMKLLVFVLFASIQTTLQAHLKRRRNEINLYYDNFNALRNYADTIEPVLDSNKHEIVEHLPDYKPGNDRRKYKPIMVLTLTSGDDIKKSIDDIKREHLITVLNKKVKNSKKSERDWFNALLSTMKDYVDLIDESIYKKPKYTY